MKGIEESFLGTCLESPDKILTSNVRPDDFSDVLCGSFWQSMKAGAHDVASLSHEFNGQQDDAISRIVTSASSYSFKKHEKAIIEDARRRAFVAAMTNGIKSIEKGADVDSVVSDMLKQAVGTSSNSFKEAGSVATDIYNELMENANSGSSMDKFMETGFDDLDFVTGGVERSSLWIVAARPSMGKTAASMQIAMHIAEKFKVCFFSIEMDNSSVGYRAISYLSQMDLKLLRTGSIKSKEAWKKAALAVEEMNKLNLYIDDSPRVTGAQIATQCRKQYITDGVDFVLVDYIGLMTPDDKRKRRNEQIAEITRTMKLLAKELNCAVMLLCQLNRDAEGQRPNLSNLRDSGDIEQDADVILFIHREDKESDNAEFIVGKNRNGPIKTIDMNWNGPTASFKDKGAMDI